MPGHLAVASLLAIRILKQSVVNKAYQYSTGICLNMMLLSLSGILAEAEC